MGMETDESRWDNRCSGCQALLLGEQLAHSIFKQISVQLNGTLISPQTDTYHYKAYIETLLNYNRDDGDTILKLQGWFNAIDLPDTLTANQLTTTHDDFKALSDEYKYVVRSLKDQLSRSAGKTRVLCMVPHIKVFQLSKLLVPNVQIGIQMYFNPPALWTMRYNGAISFSLNPANIKVKMYLCQVRLNPSVYRELVDDMSDGKRVVSYPTVRSEIRTYNIQQNTRHYEINNPFQNWLPNMVVIGLVRSTAFNGHTEQYPFTFKDYKLISIKQIVRGDTYPYEPLELDHNNDSKDYRGYSQFLQATGSLCKSRGNMVRGQDWGHSHHCTLFVYENAANGCLNSPVLNPKLAGELRLVLDFGADQGANIMAIVYAEFENLMEVNSNKTIQYDIYQA